ncbi:hypothetical protein BESB_047670 [Besnoitia besnoiti]|uniref:Transmembrane protein n=1 Tax=Besnoitia besnoiti TaxID=94643 RepID=A0A2A9MF06_BESBE|nr:hypothetical protein BESB_047670 [Besnoitia besnoiti]PFH36575.1 hypothetical protein BESB_047670 [Besnoitia besnoiti]
MRNCLGTRLYGEGPRGLDLTYRDCLKLLVPFGWTVAACCIFAYYCIEPIANSRFPKTIPMYWSLISAFPAFMTALNTFVFHRDAVVQSGLSRVALAELTQVVRLISVIGVFTFITLAVASAIQLAQCRLCTNDSYKENVVWCGVSLAWMVVMAVTTPTARHFSKLIFRHETFQEQAGGLTPTLCCTSSEAPPSLRPVPWGSVGPHHGAAAADGAYVVTTGYPADGGARTLRVAGDHAAEDDYIRAAAGASPGQVVTGKVSSKAESKLDDQGSGST